jgi:arginyl-tRNA synthetase
VNHAELSAAVQAAVSACLQAGEFGGPPPTEVLIERPRNPDHGDYATNVALRLAKSAGRPPRDIAAAIAMRLREVPGIESVDVAGPGFLNIRLSTSALGQLAKLLRPVGQERVRLGRRAAGYGRARIE